MVNGKNGDTKAEALRRIYEQAFWLYTIIIGLAIRQVLIEIIPRFFNHVFTTALPLPTPELSPSGFGIELFRSLVFLVVITRFYLGSVLVLAKLTAVPAGPTEGSWVHVGSGFVHFLLFFGWAYTPFVTATTAGPSLFVYVLITILLWDIVWLCLTPKDQKTQFRPWVYRNIRTVVYMAIAFFSTWYLSAQAREAVMLLIVVVISIKDFWEIFTKRDPPQKFFAFF
jgi:hypothetical protein